MKWLVLFLFLFFHVTRGREVLCKGRKNVIRCQQVTLQTDDVLVVKEKKIRYGREYVIVLERINGEITSNSLKNFPYIFNVLIVGSNITKLHFSHTHNTRFLSVFPIVIQESIVADIIINTKIVRSLSIYDSTVPNLTEKSVNKFCGNLTGMVVINVTDVRIDEGAFRSCRKLNELTLRRANLKKLTKKLFEGLHSLEILMIEDKIDSIEERTFMELVGLQKLSIDTDIDVIQPDTFRKLTNLKVLSLRGRHLQVSNLDILSELKQLEVLEIPTQTLITLPVRQVQESFPNLKIVVLEETYMKTPEGKSFLENVNYTVLYKCPLS